VPNIETAAPGAGIHQLKRVQRGLKLLTVSLPYLSGLAAAVRVTLDARVPTMGVFASGRLVVNPAFAEKLKENELIFVLAHELLHLALRTHDRARGSHHLEFNYAHDYIINDILRRELGMEYVPAGGLDMPGASQRSAEEIVLEMRRNAEVMPSKTAVFDGEETTVGRVLGPRGRGPGGDSVEADAGDVLGTQREKELFPDGVAQQAEEIAAVKERASSSLALARAVGSLKGMRGDDPGGTSEVVTALRGIYRTPWEVVLQRWMESVAPGERTFVRASRRGAPPAGWGFARPAPRGLDAQRDSRHEWIDGGGDPARARRHRGLLRGRCGGSDSAAAVRCRGDGRRDVVANRIGALPGHRVRRKRSDRGDGAAGGGSADQGRSDHHRRRHPIPCRSDALRGSVGLAAHAFGWLCTRLRPYRRDG
jgi:hypothetical protein